MEDAYIDKQKQYLKNKVPVIIYHHEDEPPYAIIPVDEFIFADITNPEPMVYLDSFYTIEEAVNFCKTHELEIIKTIEDVRNE